jgi:hypothetical protein
MIYRSRHCYLSVIPAKAGIHASHSPWIPAFAGMTSGNGRMERTL